MTEAQLLAVILFVNAQMTGRAGSVTLNFSRDEGLQDWEFHIPGGPKDVPALSRK